MGGSDREIGFLGSWSSGSVVFPPGQLLSLVQQVSARALEQGALRPVPTHGILLLDQGVAFGVRVLETLARKAVAESEQPAPAARGNPFLPYDPELFVAEVSDAHVALLNKFNVVPNHLLIVTRHFEDQQEWLTREDLAAWLNCLDEYPSLGFFNSGTIAGASQPHKHLQLVPLPLGPEGPPFPLWPRWQAARRLPSGWHQADLPFPHALARWREGSGSERAELAASLEAAYRGLLDLLQLGTSADPRPRPHNLLLTSEWLFAVPRTTECVGSVSLNAMAFAGGFFVRDTRQLEQLRAAGPFAALQAVTRGPSSPSGAA